MGDLLGGILGGVASFAKLTGSTNDDSVDRLNHLWTVMLLAIFAIFVTTGQFVGDAIHCWVPAQFPGPWVDYAKSICWVSNTYYIPIDDTIPTDIRRREDAEIQYYQWIPLILMFMALMFKIPNLAWRLLNTGTGLNLDKLVDLSQNTQLGSPEEREKTIDYISVYMDRWLEVNRQYKKHNKIIEVKQKLSGVLFFMCAKRQGTYLVGVYVFSKCLYVANVIGQFFLLNAFLAMDYNLYGFEVLTALRTSGTIRESPRFPRVTLCDFQIRQMTNVNRYTVQCVLPINLFSEKIFIFFWFWLVLVAVATVGSLFFWLYRIVFRQNRPRYIKKYLHLLNAISTASDKKLCAQFANEYLRDDGIFVLRVIGKNSTDLVVTDVVGNLWKIYKVKQENKRAMLSNHEDAALV